MTTPAVLPTGFDGTSTDYLKCKVDRDGCNRTQYTTVTVADAATVGTTYGLVPFNKGFRLTYGSQLYVSDLDTASTVTLNIGYSYKTGSTATDDPDAFASAVTTAQSGGLITFDEHAGLSWVAEDDGWISVAIAAGPTTEAGTISGQLVGCYDGLNAVN